MRQRLTDALIVFIALGLPLLFAFSYTGPYQWLAETQLALVGSYELKITLFLTVILWVLACGGVLWLIAKLRGRPLNLWEVRGRQEGAISRMVPTLIVCTCLVLLGIAGYLEHIARRDTSVTHVQFAALKDRWTCPSYYLAIDDATSDGQWDHSVKTSGSGLPTTTHYLPLVPENYQKGQPVYAFVEILQVGGNQPQFDEKNFATGLVSLTGLPGMTRTAFERDGFPVARNHIVLQHGKTPASYHGLAGLNVIAALAIAAISLLYYLRAWWKNRPARQESGTGA